MSFPRSTCKWLGSGLGSTWFHMLQTSGLPESHASGLVPDLVPLGSTCCRKVASQKHIQVAWFLTWFQRLRKSGISGYPCRVAWFLSWFHLVPEVAEAFGPRNKSRVACFLVLVPLGSRSCRNMLSQIGCCNRKGATTGDILQCTIPRKFFSC